MNELTETWRRYNGNSDYMVAGLAEGFKGFHRNNAGQVCPPTRYRALTD